MKTTRFSADAVERTSLNFLELREEGIKYLQKFCGDTWTDYNAHDPGVTILELLCFALTDVAYRLEYPLEDLLAMPSRIEGPQNTNPRDSFFEASAIFSSHPVTLVDQIKLIIDAFDEVQNVWIEVPDQKGYEEKLISTRRIEILPNLIFNNRFKIDGNTKATFVKRIQRFLTKNRNLAEDIDEVCLLENQNINIVFSVYLEDDVVIEEVIAQLFLTLFELIYRPIPYYTYEELIGEGYDLAQIFSGPRLSKGIIKDNSLKTRVKTLSTDGLQKLLSKVKGVINSKVTHITYKGTAFKDEISANKNKFFHLIDDDTSGLNSESRMTRLFENMDVHLNNELITVFDKSAIARLVQEAWAKKYRQYPITSHNKKRLSDTLKGTYRDLGTYHSIQHHFPMIYGVGNDGFSQNEPIERQAKAMQLKGYLMFFEQLLTNDLAQLGNLSKLFSLDHELGNGYTYFSQPLTSIPKVDALYNGDFDDLNSLKMLESSVTFYNRKNRMLDHLLARFGEELNPIPWEVAYYLKLIPSKEAFNEQLLESKSKFLSNIERLNYMRMSGASFRNSGEELSRYCVFNKKEKQSPSGLAAIISVKTGISCKEHRLVSRGLLSSNSGKKKMVYKKEKNILESYESVVLEEDTIEDVLIDVSQEQFNEIFGGIFIEHVFKNTLDINNYLISKKKGTRKKKFEVIFNRDHDSWIPLFESWSKEEALHKIQGIMGFMRKQNLQAEGFYVIDHILLRDFLMEEDVCYGFSFLEYDGSVLFYAPEVKNGSNTPEERLELLEEFYDVGRYPENYVFEKERWVIKGCSDLFQDVTILCYADISDSSEQSKKEVFDKAQGLLALFDTSRMSNGRTRFKELEAIRLRGIGAQKKGVSGQRRLIFNRRISNERKPISEDFFNLKISVVLPNWPIRFQDKRFMAYFKNLIRERTPAHIYCDILIINKSEMRSFETDYYRWKKLKSSLSKGVVLSDNGSYLSSLELKKASYTLYKKMITLEKNARN